MAVITIGKLTINSHDVVAVEVENHLLLDCVGLMLATAVAILLSFSLSSVGTAIGLILLAGYIVHKGGSLFGERASYVVVVRLRNGTKVKKGKLTRAAALTARHDIAALMTR